MSFEEKPKWKQITIVGCGLIGSSFALAIKKQNCCERVLGWDIALSNANEALALGIIDGVDSAFVNGEVSDADLLYLAMPVLAIIEFLTERLHQTKSGAIITDAGSTKREICNAASQHLLPERHFIGGHPIAGSHLSGLKNASSELMAEADYVLIDNDSTDPAAFRRLRQTLAALGARPRLMTAAQHDRTFALVSHLPQLLSSTLARIVEAQEDTTLLQQLAGPGYKEMTRLAESSWSIWRDIVATNGGELLSALDQVIDKLTSIRADLDQNQALDNSILSTLFRQQP